MTPAPVLVACGHGTRSEAGRRTISELVASVREALPGVEVQEAYVDVHGPRLTDVVTSLPPSGVGCGGVVVPLLLAAGHHVHHDISSAVSGRHDVLAAPALGPDPSLVDIVLGRLAESGVEPGTPVVLAPAGSTDDRYRAASERTVALVSERWGGPVRLGYAGGSTASVVEAVAAMRDEHHGAPVAVASYLLAPGLFQDRLAQAGADVVTAPLAPHPRLLDLVAARYRSAWARLQTAS